MTNDAARARQSRTTTPVRNFYMALGALLTEAGDDIYTMTERDFVARLIPGGHGTLNPEAASRAYRQLMADAGLPPLVDGEDDARRNVILST